MALRHIAEGRDGAGIIELDATLLFVDVSGFSRMTARLAERGHEGAELISDLLDTGFGPIIDAAEEFGGDVVSFAGDALLAIWSAEDPTTAGRRGDALAAAGAILERVDGQFDVDGVVMRVRIGVAEGRVALQHLGDPQLGRFFVAYGEAVQAVSAACGRARPGEIRTPRGVVPPVQGPPGRVSATDGGAPRVEAAEGAVPAHEIDLRKLKSYVGIGGERIEVAASLAVERRNQSELREVATLFIQPTGDGTGNIEELTSEVQRALHRLDGRLHDVVIDDKGLMLMGAFGLQGHSHEDDALRAVRAAMDCSAALGRMGVEASIGVTTGRAFFGPYGTDHRRHATIIGPSVNWAVRLMQAADGGILMDGETARRALDRVALVELPPIEVKGSAKALEVWSPAGLDRGPETLSFSTDGLQRPIVGRGRELAQIEETLAAGAGGLLVVGGDVGIGKSAVLASVVDRLRRDGRQPLVGSGNGLDRDRGYLAWRSIFSSLWAPGRADDLEQLREAATAAVVALGDAEDRLPLLNVLLPLALPETPTTRSLPDELRGSSIQNLLLRLLGRGLDAHEHVLVIDDVQWLDSASLALLWGLRRQHADLPMLLAMRPVGENSPPELDLLLATGGLLSLEALPDEEAAALAAECLAVPVLPDRVKEFVARKSGGNPLFVQELMPALIESGLLAVQDGRCRLMDSAADLDAPGFPDRAHALIISRLDRLPSAAVRVARLAAVLGTVFPRSMLEEVAARRLSDIDHPTSLEALQEARVLRAEGQDGWAFHHSVIQEAVYSMTSFAQRREFHSAVAEYMEGIGLDNEEHNAATLARHWLVAGREDRAAHYLVRAADHAAAQGAGREAIRFYRRRLELQDSRKIEAPLSPLDRARIHRHIGVAYFALGDFDRSGSALVEAMQRLGIAVPKGELGWALRCLREVARQGLHLLLPRALIASRSEQRCDAHATAARAAALDGTVRYHQAELTAWLADSLAAINLAERAGRPAAAGSAYGAVAYVAGIFRLHGLVRRYLALGRTSEFSPTLCDNDFSEGLYHLGYGRLDQALQLFHAGLERARRAGDRLSEGTAIVLAATAWAFLGSYRQGRLLYEELETLSRKEGNEKQLSWARAGLASLAIHEIDLSWAEERLVLARQSMEAEGPNADKASFFALEVVEAANALRRGDFEGAERSATEALALGAETPMVYTLVGPISRLHDVILVLWERALRGMGGDAARFRAGSKAALVLLRKYTRTFPVGRARLEVQAAGALRLAGRFSRARKRLAKARKLAGGTGARLEAALADWHEARTLADLGADPSNHFRAAREGLEALGMEAYAAVLETMDRAAGRP
jgi:class 3 adenylate cyclase/tetratricopeptide (TPR) repeat protein